MPEEMYAKLRGRFLAFEGGDGSGKSTQARRLAQACRDAGLEVCEVREPGGTEIGERIRAVLLDKDSAGMALRCEMLLYMASRAQLIDHRIGPALRSGALVIADRFLASTYAYQGHAGGLAADDIAAAASVACRGVLPDLNVIFDVDARTAARRTGLAAPSRRRGPAPAPGASLFADRMEDRDEEFRRKVRESYLDQARRDPDRHVVIDARGEPEQVWAALLGALRSRLAPA